MAESAGDVHIVVRVTPELKRWAQSQAAANRRSLNAQMVVWLEQMQVATAVDKSLQEAETAAPVRTTEN